MRVDTHQILALSPGIHRVREDLSGSAEWSNGRETWTLSRSEHLVAQQFVCPTAVGFIMARLKRDDQDAVLVIVSDLVRKGLLEVPAQGSEHQAMGPGIFLSPVLPWDQAIRRQPDVLVVGVPYDVGVTYNPGARFGPETIRRASTSIFTYREKEGQAQGMYDSEHDRHVLRGRTIVDLGDIQRVVMPQNGDVFQDVERIASLSCRRGGFPLILGGDHSIALPTIRGVAESRPGLVVIHFDAHHDFAERRSGDYVSKLHHGNFLDWVVGDRRVDRVISIGVRQLSSVEPASDAKLIKFPGLSVFADDGLHNLLMQIPENSPVHLTIDVDILDPSILPSTGTRLPRGWSLEQLVKVIQCIGGTRRVISADVCELSGRDEVSGLAASEIVLRMLDCCVRGSNR